MIPEILIRLSEAREKLAALGGSNLLWIGKVRSALPIELKE
jgi:hypothetical protein